MMFLFFKIFLYFSCANSFINNKSELKVIKKRDLSSGSIGAPGGLGSSSGSTGAAGGASSSVSLGSSPGSSGSAGGTDSSSGLAGASGASAGLSGAAGASGASASSAGPGGASGAASGSSGTAGVGGAAAGPGGAGGASGAASGGDASSGAKKPGGIAGMIRTKGLSKQAFLTSDKANNPSLRSSETQQEPGKVISGEQNSQISQFSDYISAFPKVVMKFDKDIAPYGQTLENKCGHKVDLKNYELNMYLDEAKSYKWSAELAADPTRHVTLSLKGGNYQLVEQETGEVVSSPRTSCNGKCTKVVLSADGQLVVTDNTGNIFYTIKSFESLFKGKNKVPCKK